MTTAFPMRLIASDLDGTLLHAGNNLSCLNRRALGRAHEHGVKIVVATGRPIRRLGHLQALLAEIPHYTISSNGACLDHSGLAAPLRTHPVPAEKVIGFCARVRHAVPDVMIALEGRDVWACDPRFPLREDRVAPIAIGDVLQQLDAVEPLKVMIHHDRVATVPLYASCQPLAEGLTCIYSYVDEHGMLEVSDAGVNKGAALRALMQTLGLAAQQVAAFGDMPNDLEMLRSAGVARAMPDSDPALAKAGIVHLDGDQPTAVGRAILTLLEFSDD